MKILFPKVFVEGIHSEVFLILAGLLYGRADSEDCFHWCVASMTEVHGCTMSNVERKVCRPIDGWHTSWKGIWHVSQGRRLTI